MVLVVAGKLKFLCKRLVVVANNWIITTSFSYSALVLTPLLESIRRHCPGASVLILTDNAGLEQLASLPKRYNQVILRAVNTPPKVIHGHFALARKILSRSQRSIRRSLQQVGLRNRGKGERPISIEQPRRLSLSTCQAHLLIRRFFWIKHLLEQEILGEVDYLMLTDARDVVLQSDPFQGCGNQLITGEEGETIAQSPMNRDWLAKAYSNSLALELSPYQALCAGVTIGSKAQMLAYLDCFCDSTLAIMRRQGTALLPNWDQGIHNKILRIDRPVALLCSPADGLISTVGLVGSDRIQLDCEGQVVVDGTVPAVLHQYDRHPALVKHLQRSYQP